MTRLVWIAGLVLGGCQAQPVLEVSLGKDPFVVREAIFSSVTHSPFATPTTLVVFGDRSGLCQAFEDPRNVCNARIVPDLHDGVFDFISRPIGVTEPLGWLALRSDTEGASLITPDLLGLSTLGASLTHGQAPVLHAPKNRAVIEHFVGGDTATFSFESELSDGRPFRGRLEATWCPALSMISRYNNRLGQPDAKPAGVSGRAVLDSSNAVVGNVVQADCEGASVESRCTISASREANCTCERGGVTSTCQTTPDAVKALDSCCNLRFGD
ncbi:MAG: hypothetical protein Q8N26_11920 [Myxococcales bacterium]|nr:hypothetical protein [Myxococcales bacterium]